MPHGPVFRVLGADKRPRLTTTCCPVRIHDGQAAAVVEYVLAVAERGPMTGHPIGLREWPNGRGVADEYAVVVEAAFMVLDELSGLAQEAREGTS